jgi:hypothetical protein
MSTPEEADAILREIHEQIPKWLYKDEHWLRDCTLKLKMETVHKVRDYCERIRKAGVRTSG